MCACPTVLAEMSRQVRHHHQSCCFGKEPALWPLRSECKSSISLCTQHARKPSLFFPFPSLVTGKGSIFSFHIWSYGALPVSSSLLMPSKHPYFVWDLYFLECFFSQFCMIVGVASESVLLKGTQPLKSQRLKRNYIGSRPLLLHRDVAGLFMIWAERIQLLMQMYPLKPTFKSKTVFYSLSFFQPTATSTPFEQ